MCNDICLRVLKAFVKVTKKPVGKRQIKACNKLEKQAKEAK